jgi:hypothetical protein
MWIDEIAVRVLRKSADIVVALSRPRVNQQHPCWYHGENLTMGRLNLGLGSSNLTLPWSVPKTN